ncbi:FixH family protein [Puia sp. P3]|uniref:FixH family protein n=1 Tax=Puia sp. P3 TaxID=3423952 RepID=UPI003D6678B2
MRSAPIFSVRCRKTIKNFAYELGKQIIAGVRGVCRRYFFLVYRCMKTPVDLVSSDYYKDELIYQQVIDAIKRANSLSGGVVVREGRGMISLELPAEMQGVPVQGTVSFYCPSDVSRDRRIALTGGVRI